MQEVAICVRFTKPRKHNKSAAVLLLYIKLFEITERTYNNSFKMNYLVEQFSCTVCLV